ncbi:Clp protease N-terminal domain-containing protein [Kitasatospora sp. NPDC001159]
MVVTAQREARDLRHGCIGTEHLLLAVLARPEDPAGGGQTGLSPPPAGPAAGRRWCHRPVYEA